MKTKSVMPVLFAGVALGLGVVACGGDDKDASSTPAATATAASTEESAAQATDVKVAGHFEIFLDTTSSTALLVTAEQSVDVMIPASTPAGKHKLLCRVDKHDGTATKATTELELTVVAKVSTSTSSN